MHPEVYRRVTRENLSKWLAGLKAQAEVLAPVNVKGLWTFQKFDSQEIPRKFQNSRLPPKVYFGNL
jgi:hypothetical protein